MYTKISKSSISKNTIYFSFPYIKAIKKQNILLILVPFILIFILFQIFNVNEIYGQESKMNKTIIISDIVYSKTNKNNQNDMSNYAVILPNNLNNSVYSGMITFTSNQSVNLLIQHNLKLNNYNIDENLFGDLIFNNNTTKNPVTIIKPQYNSNQDLFAASILFVGNSVLFTDDDPFFVMYTINAIKEQYESPETNLSNIDVNKKVVKEESVDPFAPPSTYVGTQLILAEVLRVLDNDLLEQLPIEQLSIDDIAEIVKKLPSEKAQLIINKLSDEQKQKLIEKLPTNKLDIINIK